MNYDLTTINMTKYLPVHIVRHVIQSETKKALPFLQNLETVTMFADISGFTSISETIGKMGARGAEDLVFCINRYMEGLVKCIEKYGGDIIKFVGDAMIVLWPKVDKEPLMITVKKAVQSALEIQQELNNKQIMQNVSKLSVKV